MPKYFVYYEGFPFELSLELEETSRLYIHEETIPHVLNSLVEDFRKRKIIFHPVIVDSRTNVVLDGMHRVEAARRAGLKYLPVCKVDYQDSRIKLEQWYRVLKGLSATKLHKILNNELSNFLDISFYRTDSWKDEIRKSDTIGAIIFKSAFYVIQSDVRDLWEIFKRFSEIEKKLADIGFKIEFIPDSKLTNFIHDVVLAPKPLTKHDVVKYAKAGKLFPRKTTRHVLPIRPLFLNVPVEICLEKNIENAKTKFEQFLRKKIPIECEGKIVLDRYYEEEKLLVFL